MEPSDTRLHVIVLSSHHSLSGAGLMKESQQSVPNQVWRMSYVGNMLGESMTSKEHLRQRPQFPQKSCT
eukprot:5352627-Karenia_brevis.AAC.1